jgi:hypothetical protein
MNIKSLLGIVVVIVAVVLLFMYRNGSLSNSWNDMMSGNNQTEEQLTNNEDGNTQGQGDDEESQPVTNDGGANAEAEVKKLAASGANSSIENVKVVEKKAMEWSDSCLEAGKEDDVCAQVITPGYRIVVQVSGATYIYHTDAPGTGVRLKQHIPAQ